MLTFNLKKQWFDKIKSGEKTHEYREVKPYWNKRFRRKIIKDLPKICFKMGYPTSSDIDKILYARLINISEVNGKNTDLKIDKPVYDIEFELIK